MRLFNAQSTTNEVLDDVNLSSKRYLITGATTGLGLESARAMALAGAELILTGRDEEKFKIAAAHIKKSAPEAQLHYVELKLEDLEQCRLAAADVTDRIISLDGIIANAGVMACGFQTTKQGFEWQLGVNHLGHFVFVNHIISLLTGDDARVAILSSGGHRFANVDLADPNFEHAAYDKWQSYGRAKTANALFAVALNRRLANGSVFAVHPGAIGTELSRHMSEDDLIKMGGSMQQSGVVMKSIGAGAATQVWSVTAPELKGKGGLYLENCSIGEESDSGDHGYAAYALDKNLAEQLWQSSEHWAEEVFTF